jgi:hypothetical protein
LYAFLLDSACLARPSPYRIIPSPEVLLGSE